MDVESPAQGSEKDDDLQKSAVSAVSVGAKMASSFRHHLPQIPMMNVGHKIAQSKASARQEVICTAATQPTETAKIHIEGSNKIVEISGTGRREEIFTPPETESSSNSSPGEEAKTSNKNGGSAMDRYGDMTGTPIKLRIRRANRDGELDLSSCIDEAPPQNTSANTSLNVSSSSSLFGTSGAPGGTPGDLHRSGTKAKGKRSKKKGLIGAVTPRLTPPVKKSEDAKDRLPKWLVGDLVWSKVSGHPWWPCMISYDPFEKIYTKLRLGKSYIRSYHVQFFGDEAERGWVGESATLVFEGKKQLEDYFKGMQLKVQPKQRALYKLEVSSRRKKAWEVAWKAAEEALPFTRMERKQKYTFSYATQSSPQADEGKDTPVASSDKPAEEDTGTGRTKTKAKLKKALITARTSRMQGQGGNGTPVGSSEDSPVNGVSVSKRGRKRKLSRYAEQESDEEEPEESTARRKQRKLDTSVEGGGESGRKSYRSTSVKCDGSFEVFRQKHRESVLSENPEFDDETLTDYMQQQWDMMDPKQKSRYRSKFASCSDGSPAKREAAATAEDPNKGD